MPDTQAKYISIAAALKIAKAQGMVCVHATMISWVKKNDLGFQPLGKGARWNVNKAKFEEFLANGPEKK